MNTPTVLVVASDDDQRRQISAWLDNAGLDEVMMCPGPGGPEYTCLGGRGGKCPLPSAADIVVVDLRLRSDEMMKGTPGWQLMLYYYEMGKQIVAICGDADAVHPRPDQLLHVVRRPIEREEFLSAIRSFAPPALPRGA